MYENLIWETRASSRLFGKDGVSGLVNVDLTPEMAARLATALGTALKRGARVVASRDSAPGCRMIKRAMISGLNAAGIDVADLRVSPPAVSRRPEDAGLCGSSARRLEPPRPGGRLHPHLRAAGDPARRGCRRRSSELHPPGAPPRRRRRRRVGLVPGPGARGTRRISSTRSTWPRSASAAFGSSSTTATRPRRSCSRSSSARSGWRRSRRTASSPRARRARVARAGDRAHEAARDGDRRRPRRGLRPVGERLYLVDEQGHGCRSIRRSSSTCASSPTAASKARRPSGHRHEQGRDARRGRARDHSHPELALRPDQGGVRRRRRLRGRGRWRLRLPGVPARLRRDREPREAARSCSRPRDGRSPSSSQSCRRRR